MYLLTAIGLTPGGSGTVHIYTQTVLRTTQFTTHRTTQLTLRLLISYIYGAPSKARIANVVFIWTYVWQR